MFRKFDFSDHLIPHQTYGKFCVLHYKLMIHYIIRAKTSPGRDIFRPVSNILVEFFVEIGNDFLSIAIPAINFQYRCLIGYLIVSSAMLQNVPKYFNILEV